jgi:hypothetical protein
MIELIAQMDGFGRAGFNAQAAALAFIDVDAQEASISFVCLPVLSDCHARSSL